MTYNEAKKRVLIIQNQVPHYRRPVFNELANWYDVTILHSGKLPSEPGRFREIITTARKVGPFFWQKGVAKAAREQFDVIIAMCDVRWLASVLLAFSKSTPRLIYWGHRYGSNEIINILRERLIRRGDGLIQYSNAETQQLVANGIPRDMIFVASNTMHIPNHSDCSRGEKSSLLFVGRAQRRKRVDILIRAFSDMIRYVPEKITLDIVGSGDENANLFALAEKLKVSHRVIFHGEISDAARLKPLFQKAYAYVSPGPVGLGVVHSLAYGVPVVTGRFGKHGPELGYLTHRENALFFESPGELEDILMRLCRDRDEPCRLGRNAYSVYLGTATFDKMIAGFVAAIEGNGNVEMLLTDNAPNGSCGYDQFGNREQ